MSVFRDTVNVDLHILLSTYISSVSFSNTPPIIYPHRLGNHAHYNHCRYITGFYVVGTVLLTMSDELYVIGTVPLILRL